MEWSRREDVKKMKPKPAVVNQGTPVRLPAFIVLSHDDIAVRAYALSATRVALVLTSGVRRGMVRARNGQPAWRWRLVASSCMCSGRL